MIRLFRTACIFQYSAAFAWATRPRQREREQERGKRGTRICFHWHTRAELGSFRKNLFSRANYVATATRHEASLPSLSPPCCILPSVCRQLVGDGWLFALRRGTGTNDHDNSVPSSMTAWHIKRKPPIRIKSFLLPVISRDDRVHETRETRDHACAFHPRFPCLLKSCSAPTTLPYSKIGRSNLSTPCIARLWSVSNARRYTYVHIYFEQVGAITKR